MSNYKHAWNKRKIFSEKKCKVVANRRYKEIQMGILEIKSTITDMKNPVDELNNWETKN